MGKSKKKQKQEKALITEFVKDCFDHYCISNTENLFDYDEDGHRSLTLFENGVLSEKKLNRAAKLLGMTADELLNCDKEAEKKWNQKYSFFALYRKFIFCQIRSSGAGEVYKERILKAIFGDDACNDSGKEKSEDIYKRMIDILKTANEKLPNSYNSKDEIIDFAYETVQFFSFPQIGELIGSFFDLVNRSKELFFKSWDEDLSEEEIKEYNFLATFLGIVDNYVPHNIYYDNLKNLIPVYRKEGFKGKKEEFLSIIHMKFCYDFTPWSCREFTENFDIAQLYASIYPNAKSCMFNFGSSVKYYDCRFRWLNGESEKQAMDKEETNQIVDMQSFLDQIDAEIERDMAYINFFEQNGVGTVLGWVKVRVPKTKEELNGDEVYAEKLIRLGGVVSKGGIRIPIIKRKIEQEGVNSIFNRLSVWGEKFYE